MAGNIWRKVCPKGHNSWTRRGDRYYCRPCDSHFDRLRDMAVDDVTRPPAPGYQGGSA